MPILTTEKISREELTKIINFGRKNKLITQKQATDLTNSVYMYQEQATDLTNSVYIY